MYDVIYQIIAHTWVQNDSMQQYVLYTCMVCIPVLLTVFIDMVYRVFSHFWRR